MWLVLYKTLDEIPYCEGNPDVPEPLPDSRVEIFNFDIGKEYWDILEKDFVEPVDKLCEALLDISDVDYLNKEQCCKLKNWFDMRTAKDVPDCLKVFYKKLQEYSCRAIELNTGITIQL